MSEVRDVIIIGSGPSGYTAAIYAARADLRPLVFEGALDSGGALMNTTDVENFPGFPEGIMGPDLMANLRAQAVRFGAEIVTDDIVAADLTGVVKSVTDSLGGVHRAKSVILAMGSGYRRLGVPGEDELSGRGVSWCATCDGFFFRDKDIAALSQYSALGRDKEDIRERRPQRDHHRFRARGLYGRALHRPGFLEAAGLRRIRDRRWCPDEHHRRGELPRLP